MQKLKSMIYKNKFKGFKSKHLKSQKVELFNCSTLSYLAVHQVQGVRRLASVSFHLFQLNGKSPSLAGWKRGNILLENLYDQI